VTLQLYTWATPNGHKPQILLAELEVEYEIKPVNIFKGEQLTEMFRQINPNRQIPVLVDNTGADAAPLRVFESGAIPLHLAEKFGRFLPASVRGRSEAIQWLMWQIAGLGPVLGQGQHFWSYAKEKQAYAIDRYTKEGQRLLSVMDRHLQEHEYLADDYSIADIACFPWVRIHELANLSLDSCPNLQRWYGAVRRRPAVERGLNILREHLSGVPGTAEAHEVMFGETQFRTQ
jgi:GSH-dependent disulfide-bond oxidoreductase